MSSPVIGTTTQVAYNSAGTMTGSANLTFDGTNLTVGGNVTANSDERIKADWAPLPDDFIERVAKTKSGTYTRTDIGGRQAGASAQDWQLLLPEVVKADENGLLSLAYGNAALVTVVKLAERVVELEARLAALEK